MSDTRLFPTETPAAPPPPLEGMIAQGNPFVLGTHLANGGDRNPDVLYTVERPDATALAEAVFDKAHTVEEGPEGLAIVRERTTPTLMERVRTFGGTLRQTVYNAAAALAAPGGARRALTYGAVAGLALMAVTPALGQAENPNQNNIAASDVSGMELQLKEVSARSWVHAPHAPNWPVGAFITYADTTGSNFDVMVKRAQCHRLGNNVCEGEVHLSTVSGTTIIGFANPERVPIPQMLVTRLDPNSSLVEPFDTHSLEYHFNPLGGIIDLSTQNGLVSGVNPATVYDPTNTTGIISVNNYNAAAGAKPGRPLADLLSPNDAFKNDLITNSDVDICRYLSEVTTPIVILNDTYALDWDITCMRGQSGNVPFISGGKNLTGTEYLLEVFPADPVTKEHNMGYFRAKYTASWNPANGIMDNARLEVVDYNLPADVLVGIEIHRPPNVASSEVYPLTFGTDGVNSGGVTSSSVIITDILPDVAGKTHPMRKLLSFYK